VLCARTPIDLVRALRRVPLARRAPPRPAARALAPALRAGRVEHPGRSDGGPADFERCSPAEGELRSDAAFQFSPILATPAQLNAEVGLSASAGLLGIERGESPARGFSPHADGNSPLSLMLARARGERLYGERASALAHAPPPPPPMPPPCVPPYLPAALS
jgi:hypothetical protein